jgi:hypothetical protein
VELKSLNPGPDDAAPVVAFGPISAFDFAPIPNGDDSESNKLLGNVFAVGFGNSSAIYLYLYLYLYLYIRYKIFIYRLIY